MATQIYWKGDLAEYTGRSEIFHGGLFYEIRLLEGHLNGQIQWVVKSPEAMESEGRLA